MSFDSFGLHTSLLAQVARQGYTTPTPIQSAAIPTILEGRDVIGLAQTGTGKTAAFVLPILQQLLQARATGTCALIVTPTRELAAQIHATIVALSKGTKVRSATVYGGVSMGPQERALRSGVDIIVACPGRLLDHLDRGYVRLDGLQTLVLDEADRMLDMGFLPAIKRILARLPARRQTLLFSATMGAEIEKLAAGTTHKAARIQIAPSLPATTVTHAIFPVAATQKMDLLLELLQHTSTESVLVFTRTKHRANQVAARLERARYSVARLHSNRSQNQRQIALDGFRKGTFQVLVATDIAARGIDVTSISHVINYDIPDTPDAYIHRIGRTGRATRTGDAFTLVTPEDQVMVRTIERAIKQPLERRVVSGFTQPGSGSAAPSPAASSSKADSRAAKGTTSRKSTSGKPAQQRAPEGRQASSPPRKRSRNQRFGGNGQREQHRYDDAR